MAAATSIKNKVLCVVMDGVGVRDTAFGNAYRLAKTPTLDRLRETALYTELFAHGTYVGLPSDKDIGNSEVGHNALGAGQVYSQGAKLVQEAVKDESLFSAPTWQKLVKTVKEKSSAIHFIGLLSDGNVHSHQDHLHAMLKAAKADGVSKARVHVLFDGRDVGEKSGEIYVERLEACLTELRDASFDVQVASGGGRMVITMDRYEADWGMVERGWQTHVRGEGPGFSSLSAALAASREDPKITDQYIPPFVIHDDAGKPVGPVVDGDAVIFYNFRGDRAIEISRAFTEPDLDTFARGTIPDVEYAGMMEYDGDLHIPPQYLVPPPAISNTLSEYLVAQGARQFACSETQKYGHVTFFWNGNRSGYIDESLEEYVQIPSDEGITFDEKPEMKAREITDATIERMAKQSFDFGRINLANGDMVGHTGNLKAAITAMEVVDREVGRLLEAADTNGYQLIITADHGNCDEMFDGKEADFPQWRDGAMPGPKTSHTVNPVPCFFYGPGTDAYQLDAGTKEGSLANVANTVLAMMGLPTRDSYRPSLIK